MLAKLRRQSVAVVAFRKRHQEVGKIGSGATQDVLVAAAAAHGDPGKGARQATEGTLVDVDHSYVLAALIQLGGGSSADAPTADDDDPHGVCASSSVSTRRHQTGAVELRITYGTVRPASQPPPKRFL